MSEETHPKATILVVDDTPDNLRLLSQELTIHGYEVRGVISGEMALMVIQATQIDLVLLDIRMPGINGYEVCQIIKKDPKTQDIPIIFLSALDETLDKIKAFAVGGVDFITKPFQVPEVLARIETHLALQASRAEVLKLNAELEQRVHDRTIQLELTNQNLLKEIAERQQVEVALRQSMQTISDILASINDGFFSLNPQWQFSYLNEQAEKLLRRSRKILINKNIWEEFPEAKDLQVYTQFYQAVSSHKDTTFEEFFTPLNTWFEVHAYPFEGGLSVYFRDISQRKQAEAHLVELEKLNELKDEFLSNVSHELRSPIANIRMAAQMLEIALDSDRDKSTLQHYLKILNSEAKREADLVDDLLELARLDAERYDVTQNSINLQGLIPDLLEAFSDRITAKEQHLIMDIPESLPTLSTSQSFLERIVTELVNNACKYSPMDATILVQVTASDQHLTLNVCNTGVEIPPQERERIFEKFYRIPHSDPFKHGGTGLGLAILKRIVHSLGATLTLISENNQTQFTVQFPLA